MRALRASGQAPGRRSAPPTTRVHASQALLWLAGSTLSWTVGALLGGIGGGAVAGFIGGLLAGQSLSSMAANRGSSLSERRWLLLAWTVAYSLGGSVSRFATEAPSSGNIANLLAIVGYPIGSVVAGAVGGLGTLGILRRGRPWGSIALAALSGLGFGAAGFAGIFVASSIAPALVGLYFYGFPYAYVAATGLGAGGMVFGLLCFPIGWVMISRTVSLE